MGRSMGAGKGQRAPRAPRASKKGGQRDGQILEALRRHGAATAQELARRLGGGAAAMRVHLRQLAAAGLVHSDEEHQRLGRPVRRFRLTPAADERFTKQYELFAIKLAETVATELGAPAFERVLSRWEDEL